MLLEALKQSPPKSLHDLRLFFDRSRARLEQSLDKGGLEGDARQRYLEQFEAGAEEAQMTFLNGVLSADPAAAKADSAGWARKPLVWALIALALVLGLILGVVLSQ